MDIEAEILDTENEDYIVPDGHLSENEAGYDKDGIYYLILFTISE